MENTVENVETAADDALKESLQEEMDASEPIESALQEAVSTDEGTEEESAGTREETSSRKEPGYIRQRIDKAVAKAVAEAEQRVAQEYERRFAPIMEKMLESEAKDLVRQGEFKSLERAKEYLRLKQGASTPEPAESQPAANERPRDNQGRFAGKDGGDPAVNARAQILARQAEKLKASRGLDVMAEFNENEETRQKVVSGEWDFYDVAEAMDASQGRKRNAPSPMRSPNGASGSEKSSIASMTKEQFARLEKNISEGKRYSV